MENTKINILVIPSDIVGGVGFYRSIQPHMQLQEQYPDLFHIDIDANPDFNNLSDFDKYNIIHVHKGLFDDMQSFLNTFDYWKKKGIVTIMDIDDYWDLDKTHPLSFSNKFYKIGDAIKNNIKRFDYVTTTTPIFAEKIKKYNSNAIVFPNAINPQDKRFIINRQPSSRLRVGLIMGSSHENDMKLLNGLVNRLPKEIKDKILFVLCGYDNRGMAKMINEETGEVTTRQIKPQETTWHRYEQCITDNYRICSERYKDFLLQCIPNSTYDDIEHEGYKRCWTKDINHYFQHFNEVDVLLVPLQETEFNSCKSQLKAIECCFSHTAIIASNFGPYKIDLVNAFEKGGTINPNGNALLVDSKKGVKDWARFITKCVENPDLVKMLQDNIYKDLHEKYDLRNITKERMEFYKKILKLE